jgi:mRNA deadenylase 3'-5' endonuclease subunit Ccr4
MMSVESLPSASPATHFWSGRIVARILPPNVEGEYNQVRKPRAQQLDPSVICTGKGPLHQHNNLPSSPKDDCCELVKPPTCSTTEEPDSWIGLDIYLYSNSSPNTLIVQLLRKSNEEATKCLQRLALSVEKKMKSHGNVGGSKQGKRTAKKNASTATLVWITSSSSNAAAQPQQLNVDMLTNKQLWSKARDNILTIELNAGTSTSSTITLLVECNPPTILAVRTFEKFNGKVFPCIPLVIEVDVLYATHAIVDWYVNRTRVCKDSRSYTPTFDDADKELSVMITPIRPNHNGEGCQEAYQFLEPVEMELPENKLLRLRPEWQQPRAQRSLTGGISELRVLTYNILADQNAFSKTKMPYYPYVPSEILMRSRRMPLLLYEILAYQADVICLQEVDELVFETLFQPVLEYHDYQGYFSVKRSAGTKEGCAMFWSLKHFQRAEPQKFKTHGLSDLITNYTSPSKDAKTDWQDSIDIIRHLFQKRPDLAQVIRDKLGHVLQIADLNDLQGNRVLVANTHLFFHPLASHIRLIQCFAICHQLSLDGAFGQPFLFCGDLNTSLENCGLLMMQKLVPKNYRNLKEHLNTFHWEKDASESEISDDDFPELQLPDSFPAVVSGYSERPAFTHYIAGFQGTLDHILMSKSSQQVQVGFRPLRWAAMPTKEQVTSNVAMPSDHFPSDHVSLVCDLECNNFYSPE